jgi:hypothetical protein
MDWPAFADPGSVVMDSDRLDWEEASYGRVRMGFRCCGTVLVEFMTDPESETCAGTYTRALPVDMVDRVPDGVVYSVPCVGAEWSADLPCGHVNGEGCDCDTIAAEAADQDVDSVPVYMSTYGPCSHIERPAVCPLDLV